IELPAVVRLSKDRGGRIDVRIRSDRSHKRPIRLALDLPAGIPSESEEVDVLLPSDSEWSRLTWTCVPSQRGKYRIRAAYVGGDSPLGFWFARRVLETQSEIRVYPNLVSERKSLAALFLKRGTLG